jgi:hypothetical protein
LLLRPWWAPFSSGYLWLCPQHASRRRWHALVTPGRTNAQLRATPQDRRHESSDNRSGEAGEESIDSLTGSDATVQDAY